MDKRNVFNKAILVEAIVRHRVQDSLFYKQYLHLTNEQTILPVIVEHVDYIGGTDSNNRPSPFLCCLVRLLEIEPSPEVIELYLTQNGYNEFKYLTALALLYSRMVTGKDFFNMFDRFITDYRKLRFMLKQFQLVNGVPVHYLIKYMDEWVDDLIEQERVVDIKIPYLAPRSSFVERGEVSPRTYGDVEETNEAQADDENELSAYESDSD
ncbi:PRP38-domain-containing protein [Metschnikowia bicuspidata]|uniref:Pre-mRNA-splicing factor 38 n=1 Tax=Metschnikowia bicuspidata TaxID=27322 RepID=A0A4P9ZIK3_9ASCO|nr:PRP38-domain-containing protein [Metschnikowia bicuspidata]